MLFRGVITTPSFIERMMNMGKNKVLTKEEYELLLKEIQAENEQILAREKLKAERNKYKPSLRKKIKNMQTATKFVITSVTAIVAYTVASMYMQYKTGVEMSTTLSTLWYGFWTVEIISLAGIKMTKVVKNYHSDNKEQPFGAN